MFARSVARPRLRAGAASLLVLAAAVLWLGPAGSPASGTPPAGGPTYAPSGWLALATGASDLVWLDANGDGIAEGSQQLREKANCLLDTTESLLAIDGFIGAGTTDAASFASNSIGAAEKKSGTSCSQVGAPAERLELRLNQSGVVGPFGQLLASSAYLDVELKFGARVLATAMLENAPVGYFELRSGSSIDTTAPLPNGVTATATHICTTSADSGPDSGVGDNCRWPISAPSWLPAPDDGLVFDSLVLQAVAGAFSLEGGADGSIPGAPPAPRPTGASLLELVAPVDGTLACNTSTETEAARGTAPQVTVRRLDNAVAAGQVEPCQLIPYTLTNADSSARFLKPLDQQKTAQFVMDMVWTLPANQPLPLPVTTVDFESQLPRIDVELGWCPAPLFAGDLLVGITDPWDDPSVPDLDGNLAGKQFACLGSQSAKVVTVAGSPDVVRVAEQVYVLGDVFLRK